MLTPLIDHVETITQKLKTQQHLQPNKLVNHLFSDLVVTIQTHDSMSCQNFVQEHNLHYLAQQSQCLCSEGEYALEMYWSKKITTAHCPQQAIQRFPYLHNYQQLVDLELQVMKPTSPVKKVLFIGSGPLPMSAILLANQYWHIDCIDKNQTAHDHGQAVVRALGIAHIHCICADIHNQENLAQYQIIIMGSLVGTTSHEKELILRHIHDRVSPGTKVIVRSSHGLRELLYPSINISQLTQWSIEHIVHPKNDIINSLIVLCKT